MPRCVQAPVLNVLTVLGKCPHAVWRRPCRFMGRLAPLQAVSGVGFPVELWGRDQVGWRVVGSEQGPLWRGCL